MARLRDREHLVLVAAAMALVAALGAGGCLCLVRRYLGRGLGQRVVRLVAVHLGAAAGSACGIATGYLILALVVRFPFMAREGGGFSWPSLPPGVNWRWLSAIISAAVALHPEALWIAFGAGVVGAVVPSLSGLRGRVSIPAVIVLPTVCNFYVNLRAYGPVEVVVEAELPLALALWLGGAVGFGVFVPAGRTVAAVASRRRSFPRKAREQG